VSTEAMVESYPLHQWPGMMAVCHACTGLIRLTSLGS